MNYTNWKKDNFSLVPNLIWRQKKETKTDIMRPLMMRDKLLETLNKFCAGDSLPDWDRLKQ